MSAIIDYRADVMPASAEILHHSINSVAATVGAAAAILETIIESDDTQAADIAHAVAELLHLQNKLLGSIAAQLSRPAVGSPGGAA